MAQTLHTCPSPVQRTIQGAGPLGVLPAGNRHADPVPPQRRADLPTALGLVAGDPTGAALRASASGPLHGALVPQGGEERRFVRLPRPQPQGDAVAPTFRAPGDWRTAAALAPAQGFSGGGPAGSPCGVLRGADECALDTVPAPVQVACRLRLVRHGGTQTVPQAGCAPTGKTACDGAPGARALRQRAPGGTGPQEPHETSAEAAMVHGGTTGRGFVGREQRTERCPLVVHACMSA